MFCPICQDGPRDRGGGVLVPPPRARDKSLSLCCFFSIPQFRCTIFTLPSVFHHFHLGRAGLWGRGLYDPPPEAKSQELDLCCFSRITRFMYIIFTLPSVFRHFHLGRAGLWGRGPWDHPPPPRQASEHSVCAVFR